MSNCKLCSESLPVIPPNSPRRCAFVDGIFNTDNHRCLTANAIRELAEIKWSNKSIPGVHHHFTESNQNYTTIDISEINFEDAKMAICLWVGWYKSRGRTEAVWIMFDQHPPRPPTEKECLLIIDFYKDHLKEKKQ